MPSMNAVYLSGNLTREPECRSFQSGSTVANFGIAINSRKRTGNGYEDYVTYVDIECWNQSAEFVRDYLHKGYPVLIEARLQLDQWQDRETGQNRQKLKVVAQRVQSLKTRESGYSGQNTGTYQQPQQQPPAPPFPQSPAPMPPGCPVDKNQQPGYSQEGRDAHDAQTFDVTEESIDDIPF